MHDAHYVRRDEERKDDGHDGRGDDPVAVRWMRCLGRKGMKEYLLVVTLTIVDPHVVEVHPEVTRKEA